MTRIAPLSHELVIDERLDSYRTFFDHSWAERFITLTGGTRLDNAAFSLCINWKAAANTHLVPWFTVSGLSQFANGVLKGHDPLGKRLVDALARRLPSEMGDSMRHMQQKKLAEVVQRIGSEVIGALETAKDLVVPTAESYWQAFISSPESHEFRLIIWGSQRICYGAVYHAYEDFVRECIKTQIGRSPYRPDGIMTMLADAGRIFGKKLAEDCLDSREVRISRLVRNALAHNGGKETDQLKKESHGIQVENGVLQIMAPDNRALFDELKTRAFQLAEKAVTLPGMK